MQYYTEMLKSSPSNENSLYNRAKILIKYGFFDKALEDANSIHNDYELRKDIKGHAYLGILSFDKAQKHLGQKYEKIASLIKEINDYESQKQAQLPTWYKGWCLANEMSINDRPPEYVLQAMIARNNIMRVLNNKFWFCLADPMRTNRDCRNFLDDSFSVYKHLVAQKKDTENAIINRHLGIGLPGGSATLNTYTNWKTNDDQEDQRISNSFKKQKQ